MIMDKIEKKAQRNQNAAFDEELLSGLLRNSPVVKKMDTTQVQLALIEIHLAEYNALRTEIIQVQTAQGQIVLSAIVALGVAIPVLSGLISNGVWHSLLLAPIFFSIMGLIHSGYNGMSLAISSYINVHLRPAINDIFKSELGDTRFDVLFWERYAHKKIIYWDPLGFRKPAESILFTIPSIASIILFLYLSHLGFLF